MRPYQVGTAAAIGLIAAVAMFDSRDVFASAPGNAPGDVGAHFYPFWSAALMAIAGLAIAYRALTTPQAVEGVFTGRDSAVAVLKLVVPMVLAATLIIWLGIYIVTGLYMALRALGRKVQLVLGRVHRRRIPGGDLPAVRDRVSSFVA